MFVGAIPEPLRAIVRQVILAWGVPSVYVGCSGNFTVERVICDQPIGCHSNDVSLYSCALGRMLVGERLPVEVKDREYAWLEPYIEDPKALVATLLLCTEMLKSHGKHNLYWGRQAGAYKAQWPQLHAETMERVDALTTAVNVVSFWPGDVLEFARSAPGSSAFVSFPPTYVAGYERLYKAFDAVFDWPKPNYRSFNEESMAELVQQVKERPYWLLARDVLIDGLVEQQVAVVQASNRARPLYVYASDASQRIIRPRQKIVPVPGERFGLGDRIKGNATLSIARLESGQLNLLRSEYLGPHIAPADASWAYGVLVDQRLIGAVAFSRSKFGEMGRAYMMTDLAVAPADYPRLSKLVLAAALSSEMRRLLQNAMGGAVDTISTTAFTDKPVSMKYRGLFDLVSRKPGQLLYRSAAGRWSLQEGLLWWMRTQQN